MKVTAYRFFALVAVTCPFLNTTLLAQAKPATAVDASTLSKYDKNHDGILDASERAAMDADQQKPAPVETNSTGEPAKEDMVVLSPFEVVTDSGKGYYASNTMSGTRFNTKVEDLASALTVVTKRQMTDFAMLNINDVFAYTAGTEGSGTYTAYAIDRNGSVSDSVQSNPTQANRVRGILPANISYGNVEMMGRIPIDPSFIDALEISRGPNANVFGLGNPSGTVNMVPASANLTKDGTTIGTRWDSYDGYRETLDINRVLLNGKLAIRMSDVFQHEGFVRKPSGVNDVYYDGMVKYKPFKNTTISASVLFYRMNGTRPNFLPPRDSVSYWLASGKPTWDPVNQIIHVNGTTIGAGGVGTTTPLTTATGVPDYFTNTFTGSTHSFAYVDQNGLGYWTVPQGTLTTSPSLTTGTIGNIAPSGTTRLMSTTSAPGVSLGRIVAQPLFTTTPTVTDKSIYDWSDINIASINRAMDRTILSNVQLDQFFFNTPRQQLVGQAGVMREDSQRYQRNLIGISNDNGQSGQLFVDVNETNLDGTPNKYFGRTYIGTDQPRTVWAPSKWDTYRAQIAYKLDLTGERSLLKWLGLHQITAYDEYKYRVNRQYSFKDAMADSQPWIPAGVSRGNQGAVTNGPGAAPQLTRSYYRYYVGDANGSNVDYGPTDFTYGKYNFSYGSQSTGFVNSPVALGQVAVTDATGAGSNTKTVLKTLGAVIQSHLVNDDLVTTFGLREDKQYVKTGATPQILNPDGITFYYPSINSWQKGDYKFNSGKTTQAGAVLRPLKDFGFVNKMAATGGIAGFFGELFKGLSLTYNKSDSFTPLDPRINLYQVALPNSTGLGKDYGFGLNLYDGKIVVRVTHYEDQQLNFRGGDASTIAQRVLRIDIASTAAFLLHTQAPLWIAKEDAFIGASQDAINAEAGRRMGMAWDTQTTYINAFNAGTIASTNDVSAHGTEVEINFNPTRYWTVAAAITDGQSSTSNVSPDIAKWISERMPIWTTIEDTSVVDLSRPTGHALWWTHNYGGSQTAAQNYATFIAAPFSVVQQLDGKSNPQIRRYNTRVSTKYDLAGITQNHILRCFSVGGAVRWESRAAIGYLGKQSLPAVITELDASRPIYDKANYYYDAFASYRTKMFHDRVGATFQFNVINIQESGHLQPIGAFPDGTINTYRIVDPRQFVLQATFEL